jgi:hypothetical protein
MTGGLERGRAAVRRSLEIYPEQAELKRLLTASPEVLEEVRRSFEARRPSAPAAPVSSP